jgi:short subunit dehydrogenase-like uncharacterized protein
MRKCLLSKPACCSGETPWVSKIIRAYHEEAARKNLRIVPCCGFDSTPFDLGALLVIDHMKKALNRQPAKVVNVVVGSKGGVSGGTIARCGRVGQAQPRLCARGLVPGILLFVFKEKQQPQKSNT